MTKYDAGQKSRLRLSIVCIFTLLVSACSTHPLPEDSSGVNTYDIARKIRCEARDAVFASLINELKRDGGPQVKEFAEALRADSSVISNNGFYKNLDEKTRKAIEKYDGTAIAYDFTFIMTEHNNIGAELNFLGPLTNGSNSLGLKAGANRERQNTRNFRLTDTFASLFSGNLVCDNRSAIKNLVYPITGEVGLAEFIETFLALNEASPLQKGLKDNTTLFADTLIFSTTITGSANPRIVISPLGKPLSLANAGITAEATRTDSHQLIVALSLPPDSLNRSGVSGARGGPPIVRGKTAAEIRASQQIDYQIDKNRLIPFTGGTLFNPLLGPAF